VRRWLETGVLIGLLALFVLVAWLQAVALRADRSWLALQQRALGRIGPAWAGAHAAWRVNSWEQAGINSFQEGNLEAAMLHLEQAASLHSLSSGGYLALGDAYLQVGRQEDALAAWRVGLETSADPQLKSTLYERQWGAHRALGDYPAAIQDLRALVDLQPASPIWQYQLGLLLAVDQPQASLAYLVQSAEIDPGLADQVRTLEVAIQSSRLQADPDYTLLTVGRALASVGEWELAGVAFRRAALARPDYAEAWAFLGEVCQHPAEVDPAGWGCQAGKAQDPLLYLQHALELDERSFAALSLMALYWQRQGNYRQAVDYLRRAVQFYPQNSAVRADLGANLALLGEFEAAAHAYQQAVALSPLDPAYYRLLAGFSIRYEYRLDELALPAARRAVNLDPQDPASLDQMGEVLFLLRDFDTAERFLQRALLIDPRYPPAHLHLALVYLMRGESNRAREKLSFVVSLARDTPTGRQALRLLRNYFP